MKIKYIGSALICALILGSFIANPAALTLGAVKGLGICGKIIIPSLFPFTAIVLFLFNCGIFSFIQTTLNGVTTKFIGMSAKAFFAVIMSFIGGFPVGAKLINELVKDGEISEKTANRMMCYSVNPGPAFVIIGIGSNLFSNTLIGTIIYFSILISSVIIMLLLSRFERKSKESIRHESLTVSLSETFVKSVASASESVIGICGYVVLFSALLSVAQSYINNPSILPLLSVFEISNGVMLLGKNIYALSFLTAFSGLCIHFQILSICKAFRLNYKMFFLFRLLNGAISSAVAFALIKLFKISLPALSLNNGIIYSFSGVSIPLCAALIFMSVTLLISLKQNNVEKRTNM